MMKTTQAQPVPTVTPTPSFGGGSPAEEPMRNFGFAVAAYVVLWCVLMGFVVLSARRQRRLDARLDELERALAKRDGAS
ncbi:MAG: CcmD family protein [Polyangiaceae bacterium]|nr:CcmD family protein [Polyangiaceae bacterium]